MYYQKLDPIYRAQMWLAGFVDIFELIIQTVTFGFLIPSWGVALGEKRIKAAIRRKREKRNLKW